MKRLLITIVALTTMMVGVQGMSYEQAQREALFLTDKMAYELNLTDEQYDAAYEINLDYLMGVTGVDNVYGDYWTRRNLDMSYILLSWQWDLYIAASYFYRPLYWDGGYWHFGVYARYPRRTFFYFDRPSGYLSYRGGHSWHRNGGQSYYHPRQSSIKPSGSQNHSGKRDQMQSGGQGGRSQTGSGQVGSGRQTGGQSGSRYNGGSSGSRYNGSGSSTRVTVGQDRGRTGSTSTQRQGTTTSTSSTSSKQRISTPARTSTSSSTSSMSSSTKLTTPTKTSVSKPSTKTKTSTSSKSSSKSKTSTSKSKTSTSKSKTSSSKVSSSKSSSSKSSSSGSVRGRSSGGGSSHSSGGSRGGGSRGR